MIKVYEDIINKAQSDDLMLYLTSNQPKWSFCSATVSHMYEPKFNNNECLHDRPQHVCVVFENSNIIDQTIFQKIMPIVSNYFVKENILDGQIERIKVNSIFKDHEYNNSWYHFPHVDFTDNWDLENKEYTSLIYYVNDSDGDTFIFDKVEHGSNDRFDLNVEERISPKQGKISSFPSNQYHASSNPITSYRRLAINIVFSTNKN
jgi:hypothetical protein